MGASVGSRLAAVVLLIGLMLTGCSTPDSGQSGVASRADSLWSARTAYVGDNSDVAALVRAAGFGPEGTYSISLQTADAPYGLTIAFRSLSKPFDDVTFNESATLVLGLVANLDHLSVTLGERTYSLTTAGASKELGYDAKDLGRDKTKLVAYLQSNED